MMLAGFGVGTYHLCQGLGYIKIKNSNEIADDKLAQKKQSLVLTSLAMFGIGIIYTLEFIGVW